VDFNFPKIHTNYNKQKQMDFIEKLKTAGSGLFFAKKIYETTSPFEDEPQSISKLFSIYDKEEEDIGIGTVIVIIIIVISLLLILINLI
jgi:hypothetical protein